MRNGLRRTILRGLACAVLAALAAGCDDPFEHSKCRTVETGKVLSPGGRYEAALFQHFCKPDTETIIATKVEVRRPNAGMSAPGEMVFHLAGERKIDLIWSDDTNLRIACDRPESRAVISQHDSWDEVNISYTFR